jgi:hypothetical protein
MKMIVEQVNSEGLVAGQSMTLEVLGDSAALTPEQQNSLLAADNHIATIGENVHGETPDSIGADPAGSAEAAVTAHEQAADPHSQYDTGTEVQARVNAHANLTDNPHGVTAAQVGLGQVDNTSDADKPVSTAQQTALDGKADLVGGTVPSSQLPGFVDDVLEYADAASFPATGEAGKIYVALDTGNIYRWATTVYVEISDSLDATEVKSLYESNADTNAYTDAEKAKLAAIENGAEANNISDTNATDLTDEGDTSLHYHISDRSRANHTGTQTASTISDFDTAVQAAETVTSLSLTTNILTYVDENGVSHDIDLSLYLDDTNLARLVSGTLDGATGIATFERDDASTFTVDFSALLDDTQVTVEDNLTSTSTTNALSANQGRVLDEKVAQAGSLPTFTASGEITAAGKALALNTDDTVSEVYGEYMDMLLIDNVSSSFSDKGGNHSMVYDPVNDYILAPAINDDVSDDFFCSVLRITNDQIDIVSENNINNLTDSMSLVYCTSGITAVVPRNRMYVYTIDEFGSLIRGAFIEPFNGRYPDSVEMIYDSVNDQIVSVYGDDNVLYATVTSLDPVTETLTAGPEIVIHTNTNSYNINLAYHEASDKYIALFPNKDNNNYLSYSVLNVTDGGITAGSTTMVGQYDSQSIRTAYSTVDNKLVISFKNLDNSYLQTVLAFDIDVSDNVTVGDPVTLTSSSYNDICYDVLHDSFVLVIQDKVYSVTLAGMTISVSSPVTYMSNTTTFTKVIYDPVSQYVVISSRQNVGGIYKFVANVIENSSGVNTNAQEFIGFSQQAVSDTESLTVATQYAVDENQTGLNSGTVYWLDYDGSLITSDAGYPVAGKALSTTKLTVGTT